MASQPKPYTITRDIQGYPSSGTQMGKHFSEFTQSFLLTATTVLPVTVPLTATAKMVMYINFSYGATVLISPAASPTLIEPTGTVTLGISEIVLNGSARNVIGGQALQFLTADTGVYVTLSYYSIYN